MGEEMADLARRHSGPGSARKLRFGRHPVAERKLDSGLENSGGAIVGIGFKCVQNLDSGGSDIAGLERGEAALIRRAGRARTGRGQAKQRDTYEALR